MRDGSIVEQGTHSESVGARRVLCRAYNSQFEDVVA